jgi:hypothetical protein
MKTFTCHCGNKLHFENTKCLVCGRVLGYLPEQQQLSALEAAKGNQWRALADRRLYRQCDNYSRHNVCNWMVPVEDTNMYCASCRLNQIIPNLSEPENLALWNSVEIAKRRLLYTLYTLGLPIIGRDAEPQSGLAFEFLADQTSDDEFSNQVTPQQSVITGHRAGLITINIREAEDSAREEMREKMKERYRTLLGHLRHESGHYYWERLISHTSFLDEYRRLFGDERTNYQQALENYYQSGPPADWQDNWISAYASSHPWEDWAETWAHYLHMVDTLETAQDFGFSIHGQDVSALRPDIQATQGYMAKAVFDILLEDWGRLAVALNALNRSMGLADAYPFVISNNVLTKLHFIHKVITASSS